MSGIYRGDEEGGSPKFDHFLVSGSQNGPRRTGERTFAPCAPPLHSRPGSLRGGFWSLDHDRLDARLRTSPAAWRSRSGTSRRATGDCCCPGRCSPWKVLSGPAQYLNLMGRYANVVEMGCRSNMTNSYCSGIIGTTPAGLIKRPSYYVMKLYADHAKAIPLQQGKNPAGVDRWRARMRGREKLCIFAVNLRREPVTFNLDLTEFGDSWSPLYRRGRLRHEGKTAPTRRDESRNRGRAARGPSCLSPAESRSHCRALGECNRVGPSLIIVLVLGSRAVHDRIAPSGSS